MVEPQSHKPNSPTSCFATPTPVNGGNTLPNTVPVCSGLCASTSTKNPAYLDTLYVDNLIGPDTVNTLPETTLAAFEDHGTLARTIDNDTGLADHVMRALAAVGVDMDDVGTTLEEQGIKAFHASYVHVLDALGAKAHALSVH